MEPKKALGSGSPPELARIARARGGGERPLVLGVMPERSAHPGPRALPTVPPQITVALIVRSQVFSFNEALPFC